MSGSPNPTAKDFSDTFSPFRPKGSVRKRAPARSVTIRCMIRGPLASIPSFSGSDV